MSKVSKVSSASVFNLANVSQGSEIEHAILTIASSFDIDENSVNWPAPRPSESSAIHEFPIEIAQQAYNELKKEYNSIKAHSPAKEDEETYKMIVQGLTGAFSKIGLQLDGLKYSRKKSSTIKVKLSDTHVRIALAYSSLFDNLNPKEKAAYSSFFK